MGLAAGRRPVAEPRSGTVRTPRLSRDRAVGEEGRGRGESQDAGVALRRRGVPQGTGARVEGGLRAAVRVARCARI